MFSADYKWQHDYVRLASDTGFHFERHKSDSFDRNKISSIDLDRVIEERDFATIEKFIPALTKFVLDPEQAQVLDESFVKTFRLSQLTIQYLLYCKKYLDNTLIIVKDEVKKVKEENKELNLFVDDLKGHIDRLMKEIDAKPTFKCTQCNKIFSSEEFLNSHIKRRHTVLVEAETDQLQMEIKELKGRLNNAEKMIQKEQEVEAVVTKETELRKIEELQHKFEDLRVQVQSELKVLQSQHNFQEKWFEKVLGGSELRGRRESTTQTDAGEDLREVTTNVTKLDDGDKENVPEISNAQKQMTEFGEALESKVTSSLHKIENQMQSFWNKLNDMERYRRKSEDFEKPKPVVKTRTKLGLVDLVKSEDTTVTKELDTRKIESETNSEQSAELGKKLPTVKIVAAQLKKSPLKAQERKKIESVVVTEGDEDTTTSETIASDGETADSPEEEEEEEKAPVRPQPVPRKRPHPSPTSVKKTPRSLDVIDEELLKHFKIEVEMIIMGRIQELGVSPEWKGLPTRSFNRAMEIVNHQATLMKKTYPNFDFISSQIEKNVIKKLEATKPKQSRKLVKAKPKKVETKEKSLSPKIEIKNRKMYDTDSDTESKPHARENLRQFSVPYSAVIEELKVVTSKLDSSKSEVREPPKEDQTKGVLKSYPSVGSLTKKKVLFNLNTDEEEDEEKKDLSSKEGGSSTSITSSVFDATPRKEQDKQKDKEKDVEDLSDFDFSDM